MDAAAETERRAEEADEPTRSRALALPHEMLFIAVGMPPVLYFMLDPWAFQNEPGRALVSVGTIALYTLACTLATHAAFLVALPRFCSRSAVTRIATHMALLVVFVVAATVLVAPAIGAMCPLMVSSPIRLAVKGIVISVCYAVVGVTTGQARRRLREMREKARAAREAALDARLRALTARTNPHFLFNSLNAGMSLIATDPERAENHFARLSSVFRYALDGSSRREVRLEDELEIVRDYLEIERARFAERLTYTLEIDEGIGALHVPPMLVQPLVENAVVHGVTARREGGAVRVIARREGDRLVVRVEDDGVGEGRSRHRGTGTALSDMRERLDIVYGAEATLTTGSRDEKGGFVAELRLPLERS